MQAYAPTNDQIEDEIERFYEEVSNALKTGKEQYSLLIGDFNATIDGRMDESETAVAITERKEKRGKKHIDRIC